MGHKTEPGPRMAVPERPISLAGINWSLNPLGVSSGNLAHMRSQESWLEAGHRIFQKKKNAKLLRKTHFNFFSSDHCGVNRLPLDDGWLFRVAAVRPANVPRAQLLFFWCREKRPKLENWEKKMLVLNCLLRSPAFEYCAWSSIEKQRVRTTAIPNTDCEVIAWVQFTV